MILTRDALRSQYPQPLWILATRILGSSNVSGERIPGGSGNKEESGTRVGARPGGRDKLEGAPRAGGGTIAQLPRSSGLVVDTGTGCVAAKPDWAIGGARTAMPSVQ